MTKEEFQACLEQYADKIEQMRKVAHELHQSVNQTYGDNLPYGYHLDMVVEAINQYGHLVCVKEDDVLPLFFAGFFHDSIEDARLTYNDVLHQARAMLTEEQALMATEIVYALTNDKGRTRAERAGEKYYKGIRETPYAPFVKLCDRNNRMREVYKGEMGHFLQSINPQSSDQRFLMPKEVILSLAEILIDDLEREEMLNQWGG